MLTSPENRKIIRLIGDTVARAPQSYVGRFAITTAVVMFSVVAMPRLYAATDDIFRPNRAVEEEEYRKQVKEEERLQQEALIRDYDETAGVDMNRVDGTETYLFTSSRPSIVLSRSTEEMINKVIANLSKQTGCPSIIVSKVWEDNSVRLPWDPAKPPIYSATAVCPK